MRILSTALLLSVFVYPSESSGEWVIDVLGPMNGRPTYATAINNRGDVVGYGFDASGYSVPFVWTESAGYRTIVGTALGQANDINNRGDVVGTYTPDGLGTQSHGFLWSESAGLVDLGTGIWPAAINDAGVIAGSCGDPNPVDLCLLKHGSVIFLSTPFPGAVTELNNRGDVVGYVADPFGPGEREQPVVWPKAGAAQFLPMPPDALTAVAYGINNRGTVVGFGYIPFDGPRLQPLVWDAHGALLPILAELDGVAVAVNAAGTIVGYSSGINGQPSQGFVWTRRSGVTFLPGAAASQPTDINSAGDIVGVINTPEGSFAAVWRER